MNAYCSPVDFFDRFDRRLIELSGDDNMPDGDLAKLNRLLDSQAAKMETALAGIWTIPLTINPASLSSPANAGDTTVTFTSVPTGYYATLRIVIGPDGTSPPEIVQIQSFSGNTATITGTGPSTSGLSFPHVAAAAIGIVPAGLTEYVAVMTASRLFGRRPSRPEELDKQVEEMETFLADLVEGRRSIPGLARASQPVLQDSDEVDGTSMFDRAFGYLPSQSGPSRGQ